MNDHAFAIGVNYWDSKSGTDMWKNWDRETVEADFAALEAVGVRYLRVFPNWRPRFREHSVQMPPPR